MAQTALKSQVHYPESNGKPMAETDFHIDALTYLRDALKHHFRSRPDVYVAGNLLLYFQEGSPKKNVAPDIFVVFGVPNRRRRVYKLWEEGKPPTIVFELTSKSTAKEDLQTKRRLYERLGVQEYFLIDVLQEYLPEPLVALQLIEGSYVPMPVERAEGVWRARSHELGLDVVLQREGENLRVRLFDPQDRRWLLSAEELEQRLAQLEAEIEQLRKG